MAPKAKSVQEQHKDPAKHHAAKISKMLGLLKYRANPAQNKKLIDMEDAQQALESYSMLNHDEKRNFVAGFERAGSGKKPGSLRFHLRY